ncbi:MAG: hypothetical protein ACI9XK_004130 [Granulosicoccus sp.]|jgi:uncharacterized protein (DUF2147 family)
MKIAQYILLVLITLPVIAEANTAKDWWLTEDGRTVVSIETCPTSTDRLCGYVVYFDSTGESELDSVLCRLPILGDLVSDGDTLKGGWLLDPITEKFYNLSVAFIDDATAISLHVFGEVKAFGQTIVWTRVDAPSFECKES